MAIVCGPGHRQHSSRSAPPNSASRSRRSGTCPFPEAQYQFRSLRRQRTQEQRPPPLQQVGDCSGRSGRAPPPNPRRSRRRTRTSTAASNPTNRTLQHPFYLPQHAQATTFRQFRATPAAAAPCHVGGTRTWCQVALPLRSALGRGAGHTGTRLHVGSSVWRDSSTAICTPPPRPERSEAPIHTHRRTQRYCAQGRSRCGSRKE